MKHKYLPLALAVLVGLVVVVPAVAQVTPPTDVFKLSQDGTPVPDVNKNPFPPVAADQSCWQATAANLLGGAGWGTLGSAQANANAIYNQMTAHFGTQFPGQCDLAINWWLFNYGYNPAQPLWYRTSANKYNDITTVNKVLNEADYNFLLQKLQECQYVGVNWVVGSTQTSDHCMTLVGGDWGPSYQPPGNALQRSVWHDSDRNNVAPGDDIYGNVFGPNWTMPAYPAQSATGYVYLCPGLEKPDPAIRNYDAAWHRDQDKDTGAVFKDWTVVGDKAVWGAPQWQPDANEQFTVLHVPNEEIPNMEKEVYLLVDFRNGIYTAATAPDINLMANGIFFNDPLVTVSSGGGQVLYHWTLPFQPPFEQILFPSTDYFNLTGDVKDFNVATICVPEPATLGVLAGAVLVLVVRRRR